MSSLADETPEGRSIVVLAKGFGIREHDFAGHEPTFVPFTAADPDERRRLQRHPAAQGRRRRDRSLGRRGGRPRPGRAAGASSTGSAARAARRWRSPATSACSASIYLKDIVKEGMKARFDQLRAMGIRTIMVTGDNKLTAAKIAEEAGVDDFLAEATPERKLELIKEQQSDGRLIAMTGDGTNDAPALAQADVGVAMNTGTQAAREAGNMVDLDSNPTKLIEIVEVGKQLLITRGALTTFSIANDVAKYFAILPAMFAPTYAVGSGHDGPLDALNVMSLGTPESAILSAVIFNALIIPLLIPLSLRGVRYRPIGATGAAAPQHADLRPRRADRPLHRDQADRPDRPQPAGSLKPPRADRECVEAAADYKIFLGMAAGVGKTYRMLQEGHAEADAGPRRRDRLPRAAQTRGDQRPGARAGGACRGAAVDRPRRRGRGDGPAGAARPRSRAGADRRARPHQPAGPRARASATRTSPTCSRPGSTSSRPSTSSTSSR